MCIYVIYIVMCMQEINHKFKGKVFAGPVFVHGIRIKPDGSTETEAEFNPEFIARMVDKLDYDALLQTVASVRRIRPTSVAPHALTSANLSGVLVLPCS